MIAIFSRRAPGRHRYEPAGCPCRFLEHGVVEVDPGCAEHWREPVVALLPAEDVEPVDLEGLTQRAAPATIVVSTEHHGPQEPIMTQSLAQADAQFFSSAWSAPADSPLVWCDFADQAAGTNDGFCQYCGSTEHQPAPTQD